MDYPLPEQLDWNVKRRIHYADHYANVHSTDKLSYSDFWYLVGKTSGLFLSGLITPQERDAFVEKLTSRK